MQYTVEQIGARAKSRNPNLAKFTDREVGERLVQRNPNLAALAAPAAEAPAAAASAPAAPTAPAKPPYKPTFAEKAGGALVGGLQAVGGVLEAGSKAIPGVAKAIATPFTRTATTVVSGAQALAGNAPSEEDIANLPDYLKPYGTKREAIGGALQIGATLLPGTKEAQALMAAAPGINNVLKLGPVALSPSAVAQGTVGGATGLAYGAGKGLETSGKTGAGAAETAANITMGATKGGIGGIGTGVVTGSITDWWKGYGTKRARSATANDAIAKAQAKDAAYAEELPGPGAAGRKKPPSQSAAAQKLIQKGWSPGDVDEALSLTGDDAKAAAQSAATAERIRLKPSLGAKESVYDSVGENLFRKAEALDDLNDDLAKGMYDLVRSNNGPVDPNDLAKAVGPAMPSSTNSWTKADVNLVDDITEKLGQVQTNKDVHELRQYIANQTNEFVATAKGVKGGPGDVAAGKIRSALGSFLDGKVDGYADLRYNERLAMDALEEFNRFAGPKWQRAMQNEALQSSAYRRGAELMRRAASNTSANLDLTLNKLDAASQHFGIDVGGDLRRQAYVAGLVERTWAIPKTNGLEGVMKSANLGAMDVAQAATGNPQAIANVGLKALMKLNSTGAKRAAEAAMEVERNALKDIIMGSAR